MSYAQTLIDGVSFSPDEQLIAVDGIRILRASDGSELISLASETFMRLPRFSPNGVYLAGEYWSGGVLVWRTSDWQLERTFSNLEQRCIGFSPDSQILALRNFDRFGSVRYTSTLHRVSDWAAYLTLPTIYISFLGGSQQLIEHDLDANTLHLRRTTDGEIVRTIALPPEWRRRVELIQSSPDGRFVMFRRLTNQGHLLSLLRLSDGADFTLPYAAHSGIPKATFTPDGRYILSGNCQHLRFWRLSDLQLAQEYTEEVAGCAMAVVFSPSGRLFAYLRDDGTLILMRNPFYRASAGDVNGDGCTDEADLLRVLFDFGQTGNNLAADTNSDGVVDDTDLLTVLFTFGEGC